VTGAAPTPTAGAQDLVLRGDGTYRSPAPDWQASYAYSALAVVVSGGILYRRLTAGTSAATWTLDATNWEALGGSEDVGRGNALPNATTTLLDAFIVENTADPVGEPNGLWFRTAGNWVLSQGGVSTGSVGTGTALPVPTASTSRVFVVENSVDPIGEPDGLWFLIDGGWVQAQAA
jgi:hypothetical protein